MEGGEHRYPGGAPGDEVRGQFPVSPAGVVQVRVPGLRRDGVGVQPLQQGQVHPHARHGVLGSVEVHVGKGLQNQFLPIVLHAQVAVCLGQGGVHPLDGAVLQHQIAPLQHLQLAQGRGVDDVPAQYGGHRYSSFLKFERNKKGAPPERPPRNTHSRAFWRPRRNFRAILTKLYER